MPIPQAHIMPTLAPPWNVAREFLSYLLSEHLWKLLQLLSEEKECIYPIQMVWVGAGEVSEKLAPVSGTIHHPLLVFLLPLFQLSVCLSPALCTFLQARLVKEAFEIPPEEISPCRFSFMSRGTGKCRREERVGWTLWLLLYLPTSVVKHVHFHQGLSGQ